MAYKVNGKEYELHYSIGRLKTIEEAAGISAVSLVVDAQSKKMPGLSALCIYFGFGLADANGEYAPAQDAVRFAEAQLQKNGYVPMYSAVLGKLMEDCGFLFQNG